MNSHNTTSTEQSNKIFIGGIPTDAKQEELVEFLKKHIKKFSLQMKQRQNNSFLNLGFAILETEDKGTYNYLLGLRQTSFRRKMIEFKPFLEGKKLDKMLEIQEETRLIASGIPRNIEEKQLILFFSKYGKIENFYYVKDFKTKEITGDVVIIFKEIEEARSLLKKGVFLMNGSAVHIKKSETIREKNKKKKKNKKRKSQKTYFK